MTSGRINQFATHCEESQEHTIAGLVVAEASSWTRENSLITYYK